MSEPVAEKYFRPDRACVCKYCGKTFEASSPADARRRKYCSRHCSAMAFSESRTGQRWDDVVDEKDGDNKGDPTLPENLHCCATCRHAVKDRINRRYASREIGCQLAGGVYDGCILNANREGEMRPTVTWVGCDGWEEQTNEKLIKKRLSVVDYARWKKIRPIERRKELQIKAKRERQYTGGRK